METGSPRLPYVYVRGKGTAIITAQAGDKTATCTVNVLEIKLDRCEIELVVGEEYTLNATTDPGGQPVTWASRNVNTPDTFAEKVSDSGWAFYDCISKF